MASERPDVGSSRISSSGSWRVARQALFLAPRKAENGRLLLLGQIDRLQDLRDAEGLWVEGAEQAERLVDGQGFRELGVLKLKPESPAEFDRILLRIETQHADRPRRFWSKAFENLNEGRLPGAVRSEEANDSARRDIDRDSPERWNRVVRLRERANLDHHDGRIADGESPMKCPASGLSGDVCNAVGRAPVRILEPE
jgi:hypothetical protein